MTIQHGFGGSGGSVVNSGVLTLSRCTVSGNTACLHGGGLWNNGTLTIISSTISGNVAANNNCCNRFCSTFGGGIYNIGGMTINNSTIAGNSSPSYSGGIFNGGTMTVSGSTISGNTGEGIGVISTSSSALSNSTVSGNTGAGIDLSSSTATLSNSTVGGNTGHGIEIDTGSMATLQNSIVANNGGGNCFGAITSNGFNLSSDGTCDFDGPGDLNNTNPLLGPLQNNGGPTQTQALLSGSPAIDAGNPSGCTDSQGHLLKTDQRGMPRPDKEDTGGCDMGAYERQSD